MTDTSLPAQIEAHEPGWYWVRVREDGPWFPCCWYHSDGEAFWLARSEPFWMARSEDDQQIREIGPSIPDPVTLQQHERLVAEIAEMEAGYKNAAELVLTYHGKNERLEAALRSAPVMSMYHGQRGFEVERFIIDYETWRKQCLAAIDKAAPETPTEGGE